MVTGQAALIAVIGQFKLLMVVMLAVSPLVLFPPSAATGNRPLWKYAMKRHRWILFERMTGTAVATSLMFLSACMVGPDFRRPAVPASQHYDVQAERQLGVDFARRNEGDWWAPFASREAGRRDAQGDRGNLDLEAADATIAQADEAVTAVGGALSPQADFGAQAGRQRASGGGAPHAGNYYAVGPRVSFDFDLFGGTRRQVEEQAALADFRRRQFDAAYLTVTSDVATQAFLLASARAQIDAVNGLLANDRKNLELVRKRTNTAVSPRSISHWPPHNSRRTRRFLPPSRNNETRHAMHCRC